MKCVYILQGESSMKQPFYWALWKTVSSALYCPVECFEGSFFPIKFDSVEIPDSAGEFAS